MTDAAALRFELPNGTHLRPLEATDAEPLARLVDENREYLGRWLPWVAHAHGPEHQLEFIRGTRRQLAEDDGFVCAIVDGGAVVGTIGLHRIDRANSWTSIGYWLDADRQGRGTMTHATRAVTQYAFEVLGLNRVEIRAAVGNARSAAIPRRLGFVQDGVLRQAERDGDGFRDVVVYSMLAFEWPRAG